MHTVQYACDLDDILVAALVHHFTTTVWRERWRTLHESHIVCVSATPLALDACKDESIGSTRVRAQRGWWCDEMESR